ncbi:Hypothetical protein I596_3462 [Dokdonella koreensis DS-123]|uniref:Uncharacterized protein n=1 Tax=Dokdonella koreensis DS-123 TaxID=1300342 RepID=A0A160DYD0_9GAMM|nr:Hypothetical protein I596_3462 [Dokdonella koreensis DS-123]
MAAAARNGAAAAIGRGRCDRPAHGAGAASAPIGGRHTSM